MKTPWAGKNSRFTIFFERLAIDMLLAARNITKACELLKISWDQLRLIMGRSVERGLSRRDLEGSRVLDVEFGRDTEAANRLWEKIPEPQRLGIKAVTLDMWDPFMNASKKAAPNADLVHDKFHVVSYLTDAVARAWATRSRLKPVSEAAYTLKRHLDNMLTYLDHRITNAAAEGFNSVIGLVKFSARGFRNPHSFRTAILFYCGRLSLYP